MIVPMLKYAFILYHNDLNIFLEHLQKLSVVDVERYDAQLDDHTNKLFQEAERYSQAYKDLKLIKIEKSEEIQPYTGKPDKMLLEYERITREHEQLTSKEKKIEKDIQEALPWGFFEVDFLKKIQALALIPHFYVVFEKSYEKEWEEEYAIQIINQIGGKVYFVLLEHKGELFDFDQQEIRFPSASYPILQQELEDIKKRISEIEFQLKQMKISSEILKDEKERLMSAFDFHAAGLNAIHEAEGTVAIIRGWIPEAKNDELIKFLDGQYILYLSEKPQEEDNPPILLKNNSFTKLYEVITRLYSLPNYSELDLTPYLAPFFMLFFGLCFGDGGYGLLVLTICTYLKFKIKNDYRSLLSLGQWFGIATMFVSLFTGSFFGMTIQTFNIMGAGGIVEQRFNLKENYAMLYLSVIVGFIQVLFAMCVNAAKIVHQKKHFKYALSKIAWVVLLITGIIYLATSQYLGVGIYLIYIIMGFSLLIAFFYNTPGKNVFFNFGVGIWDAYNTAAGLLGDLLSYIRLFALGFTGGVLGMVFNKLAFSISIDIPILGAIATGLVLIIGHTLNIMLNGLGAFVHPLRLTFVEFYKNAGFEGGGRKYNPFKIN